jgi:hypothetical protein
LAAEPAIPFECNEGDGEKWTVEESGDRTINRLNCQIWWYGRHARLNRLGYRGLKGFS